MDEYLVNGAVGMTRGSLLRFDDAPGLVIYVWDGELWLTQEGDRRDHIVKAGEWFRLDRGGAAVAYALQRSRVSITSPRPERAARGIQLTPAGTRAPVMLYGAAGAA